MNSIPPLQNGRRLPSIAPQLSHVAHVDGFLHVVPDGLRAGQMAAATEVTGVVIAIAMLIASSCSVSSGVKFQPRLAPQIGFLFGRRMVMVIRTTDSRRRCQRLYGWSPDSRWLCFGQNKLGILHDY